jgi:negative regulator of flagellin synthesis FlgM
MDIRSISGMNRAYQEQMSVSSKNKTDKTKGAQERDEVVLSSQALEYSNTVKSMKSAPDIREAKIVEISEKIANGTYHIPAEKIAASIIAYSKYN